MNKVIDEWCIAEGRQGPLLHRRLASVRVYERVELFLRQLSCRNEHRQYAKSFKMNGVHRSRHEGSRKGISSGYDLKFWIRSSDLEVMKYMRIHRVLWSTRT